MNSSEALQLDSNNMPWTPASPSGAEQKLLATATGSDRYTTTLVQLAAGQSLPAPTNNHGMEAMVLDGDWDLTEGTLTKNGYSRRPPGQVGPSFTKTGCTLFVKVGPFAPADQELIHLQTNEHPWLPGQGNLRVKPLHSFEGEGTALVHWPAGERFMPHKHWGGEEILVLSGTFQDEHGRYPQGTWLRSPHLSAHYPFVEEETVIFVKTGHLPGSADEATGSRA